MKCVLDGEKEPKRVQSQFVLTFITVLSSTSPVCESERERGVDRENEDKACLYNKLSFSASFLLSIVLIILDFTQAPPHTFIQWLNVYTWTHRASFLSNLLSPLPA